MHEEGAMMLKQFKDYLKSLDVANNYYIGKIDNSKEETIGVYSMPNIARVEAFGKDSTYDMAGVQILVHWNRNANETEIAARNLYDKIKYINEVEMTDVYVYFIRMDSGEPNFIGTDDNGIYEYHISAVIFYRKEETT